MSYDFACFRLPPGADPETIYAEAMEDESDGPLIAETEAAKQRLADLLRAKNPRLEQFAWDYDRVAANHGISVEEARRRYRYIELTDEESGLQITINDRNISITIPYWHKSGQAEPVFEELWTCLKLIEEETGYNTYDPQLEEVLSLEEGRDAIIARYCGVSDNLEQIVLQSQIQERPADQRKRPWWKFW